MASEASNSRKRAHFPSISIQHFNFTIPILPAELITEILSRLPVKSLLKFRSVSKSWLALISSHEFINTHLSLSVNKKEDTHHMFTLGFSEEKWNFKECPLRSLFDDSVTEALDLDYLIENNCENFSVVGSCNGLIFLAHCLGYWLLWNPTIRKYKNLPGFRPRRTTICVIYGFEYDELHDDYKIMGIFYDYGDILNISDGVEVEIYSLKSDSWSSVDFCGDILNISGSSRKIILKGSGLFANGKLHWDTVTAGPNFIDACMGRNVISFDLVNEKWEKMEKPSYEVGETDLCMGMLGSDFCVFSDYKGTHLGAWVMNEYGVKESWTKKFTIMYPTYPTDRTLRPPFFMSNKGEILAQFRSTFMICDSKDDSFRSSDVTNYDQYHDKEIYVESLVCPFSTEGIENATKGRLKKLRSNQSSNK